MKNNTKRIAYLGIFASLALVLSFVEAVIPPIWAAVPGIKVGLPNIIIIFLLYKFTVSEAATVSFIRLVISSLLFGNAMTFVYSLAGAGLSLFVMWILKKTTLFSMVGVSIAGGVCHNLGQIATAAVILSTKEIGFYFPVLAVTGTLAGIFVGLAAIILLKYAEKLKL